MNQSPQQEANLPNCAEQIAKLPFWTRGLFFSFLLVWLFDLLTTIPADYIATNPNTFFNHYRIWTLFTANFYIERLFFIILIIYNYYSFLPHLEKRISTPVLILKYLLNGALIQLIVLTIQNFVVYGQGEVSVVNGAAGVWFSMLTKYCLYNSKAELKFCCFGYKFKRGYYPFVFFAVCCLLDFGLPLDILVGLLYGLMQFAMEKVTSFPSVLLTRLAGLVNLTSFVCWMNYEGRGDYSDHWAYQHLEQQQGRYEGSQAIPKSSPDTSTVSDPFSNKKGVRLGDY